jgi:phosphoenolpyruvate carboxylase
VNTTKKQLFEKLVKTKFNIYNSLFLNLPYRSVSNIGMLIPLLYQASKTGLAQGENPADILHQFFTRHTDLTTEKQQIAFMFQVIQYVERQVVLYDSVEDAAFAQLHSADTRKSIGDYISDSTDTEKNKELIDLLAIFSVRIVFTAHPTQFYTPAVLDIIEQLRQLIPLNKLNEVDTTLQQLGLTSLINANKPTPLDEAKNIIYYLRNVYYDAIGDFYTQLQAVVPNKDFVNHNIVKLGFWPGGDRDGNPFVTAETTWSVANELRTNLMKCYYNDIKKLQKKLSFRAIEEPLANLRSKLYQTMFDSNAILSYEEIHAPLVAIKEELTSHYHGLYLQDLNRLINKVAIFKNHFATLDIRQDHSEHVAAIRAILLNKGLIKEALSELNDDALIEILLTKDLDARGIHFDHELINDTIKNIEQLKEIQARNGEEGCNRYIISNSEDKFAVLFVFALFRWSGWKASEITFDIVPLFETMKGMRDSEDTMNALFANATYREHIKRRNERQTIMLGFSDGTKDGGYFKANWSIYKTKESLTGACAKNGIEALFFDGRGGPPSRGGGKSHRFYAAQSNAIANNEIQLTIQGQTITSNYGTQEQFNFNCDQLITAGLSKKNNQNGNQLSDNQRALLEELSTTSFGKYDELKHHTKFMPYLEHRSTLKYYGKANIGSRPGKRGDKKELTLSDLRAISFVGSWSQLKQNVPGYFGTGTAIKKLVDAGKLAEVQALFHDVPLFKALCLNSMMSISKSYFELTSYMKEDPEFGEFWKVLHAEFELSKAMMLLVSGYSQLMEEEPIARASIHIREKIVLPLLVIQQNALQAVMKGGEYTEQYEKIITRSLYGNINASRNSA